MRTLFAVALVLVAAWLVLRGDGPDGPAARDPAPETRSEGPSVAPAEAPTSKLRVAAEPEGASPAPFVAPAGGFVVRGRVTGPGGAAVGGARVRVTWREAGRWPPEEGRLEESAADAAGDYSIDVDALLAGLPTVERLTILFTGTAHAPGLHGFPRTERLRHPAATDVSLDLVLEADRGVTGRVVDARGAPVAGADVHFRDLEEGPEVAIGRSRDDGSFRTEVPRPASYVVSAHAPGEGVGVAGPFEIDPRVPTRLPDLVCEAPGAIEGLAVLPDGNPAVGLEVVAFPASEAGRSAAQLLNMRLPVGPDTFEGLDGAWPAVASTDRRGAFRVAGLGPGLHFLLVRAAEPAPDDRALHPAGATGVLLRVVRHRIVADVRDPSGERIDARVGFVRHSMGFPPTGLDPDGRPVHDGVSPGDEVTVEAVAPGVGEARRTVEVSGERPDTVVRLDLAPVVPRETGRLVIALEPAGDAPATRAAVEAVDRLGVRLLHSGALGLRAVLHADLEVEARPGEPIPLDAGDWSVILGEAGAPWTFGDHRGTWFEPARTRVTVEPGRTATATLTLAPGGRLGLRLSRADGQGGVVRTQSVDLRAGGRSRRIQFVGERSAFADPWRPYDVRTLPLGVPLAATSLLPAGEATFRLDCTGFDPIERTVEIEAGRTTVVEVMLRE